MIYVVTEEGVYRHRILGIFDSQEKAEARALEIANQEDGYHSYSVSRTELNDGIDDVLEVCRFERREDRVRIRDPQAPVVRRTPGYRT